MDQHQTHTDQTCRYKDQGKSSQQKEYFVYDAIDRLTQVELNDVISQQISYDQSGLGNITRKTGVTTTDDMVYGGAGTPPVGPYALTEIPAVSPDFSCSELQNVHYTNFDKVSFIDDNSKVLGIDYGYDLQRIMQTFTKNHSLVEVKVFAGGLYEEISNASGNVRKLHYIPSPDGVFAIYVDDLTEGKKMHYILKDHLGSYNVIADEQGNKLEELSFDAWGSRRNPDTWTKAGVPISFIFDRGFTGHEHLDEFGLINMNGRVYDDAIGRFLSPDPFVQMPDNAQNFNRYSYCLNNPLIYTDPSGNLFVIDDIVITAAIVGAVTNTGIQAISGNINNVGDFFLAAGIGALSGYAGASLGASAVVATGLNPFSLQASAVMGSVQGFTSGFIAGAGNSWVNGAGFGSGFLNGLKGGVAGGITGAIISGISGMRMSNASGRNPVTGNPILSGKSQEVLSIPSPQLKTRRIKLTDYSEMEGSISIGELTSPNAATAEQLNYRYTRIIESTRGKPYVYGANGPNSFDCSGNVCYGLRNTANSNFGDYTAKQLIDFTSPISSSDLQSGNLIFYEHPTRGIKHVVTFIGDNAVLHPSDAAGKLIKRSLKTVNSWFEGYKFHYRKICW